MTTDAIIAIVVIVTVVLVVLWDMHNNKEHDPGNKNAAKDPVDH